MKREILRIEPPEFEKSVRETFRFLESDLDFACAGLKIENSDPRAHRVFIRYRRDPVAVTVAMNEYEWNLGILVRLDSLRFPIAERYVGFEPFVQFVTDGEVNPLVPYQGKQYGRVLTARRQLFERLGFDGVMHELGVRAKEFLPTILNASEETIAAFQRWSRELPKKR